MNIKLFLKVVKKVLTTFKINDNLKTIRGQYYFLKKEEAMDNNLGEQILAGQNIMMQTIIQIQQNMMTMQEMLQNLVEGQKQLRKDVDELKRGQEELRKDVDELKRGQEELRKDVDELKLEVKRLDKKIDKVKEEIVTEVSEIISEMCIHIDKRMAQ